MTTGSLTTDTIDLADLARSLRRGWRLILGGFVAGGVIAALVVAFGPRRFDGTTSAIVRTSSDPGTSLLARVGEAGGAAGGAAALLGGGISTPLETELQILQSRVLSLAAVDSLLLQAEPRSPAVPAVALLRALRLPGGFKPHTYDFERTAAGQYRVRGAGVDTTVAAGANLRLPVGTLSLRHALPPAFAIKLFDREDALERTMAGLTVGKAGGEVVQVRFRARDSITAAAVPNLIVANYLVRRRTVDRGTNAHRVEFLTAQIDSNAMRLAAAEQALREFQERSGVVDAPTIGKLALEQAAELHKELGTLEVESGALGQLLEQVTAGKMSARQLAAYPSFLRSPGINELLKQLSELETERTRLLERRLESDEEVRALTRSIDNVEGQLLPLARAYNGALTRQRQDVTGQIRSLTASLGTFPRAAQSATRLTREVLRLSQLSVALQGQLAQARLSAINEGGDVRPLDIATPPFEPAFPKPALTASLGLGAGALVGMLLALFAGSYGRYFDGPRAIERSLGVPALRLDAQAPLLMSGRAAPRTVLLIPVEPGVDTAGVAERLSATALARGDTATIVDLSGSSAVVTRDGSVGALIAQLEAQHALVVVRLAGLTGNATAAVLSPTRPVLLIASSHRVSRRTLTGALDTLRRLEIPCAGIVLSTNERVGVLTA